MKAEITNQGSDSTALFLSRAQSTCELSIHAQKANY